MKLESQSSDINFLRGMKRKRLPPIKHYIVMLLGCFFIIGLIAYQLHVDALKKIQAEKHRLWALQQTLETKQHREQTLYHPVMPSRSSEIMHHGKSHYQTDSRHLVHQLIQLHYANAQELAELLKDKSNFILSPKGSMLVDSRTNTLWIQDKPKQLHIMRWLIHQLDVPIDQVMIEARIVNMSKGAEKDIGVRFSNQTSATLASSVLPYKLPLVDRLTMDLSAIPLEASPASLGIALAKLGDNILLDLELSALESEGKAEIVASPRLMTINQQPAMIKSGEDIPYQEVSVSGATSVAFKQAVLSLKVTPHITPKGQLLMDLLINQDSDSGRRVQGVPILITKSITTRVLVNNSQTIVLGGIYKHDKNRTWTRVPFLGQLPIVGHLFGRKGWRIKHEELLIFITPKIIYSRKLEFAKSIRAKIDKRYKS